MPNTKSAIKRIRSDAKKRERNHIALEELKTLDRKLRRVSNDQNKAEEISSRLISRYDRAASRGIIPRGRADRRKSRIAAFVRNLKSSK